MRQLSSQPRSLMFATLLAVAGGIYSNATQATASYSAYAGHGYSLVDIILLGGPSGPPDDGDWSFSSSMDVVDTTAVYSGTGYSANTTYPGLDSSGGLVDLGTASSSMQAQLAFTGVNITGYSMYFEFTLWRNLTVKITADGGESGKVFAHFDPYAPHNDAMDIKIELGNEGPFFEGGDVYVRPGEIGWLDKSTIALVAAPFSSATITANVAVGGYVESTSEVPLPAAAWLFGSAVLGLLGLRRKTTRERKPPPQARFLD